MSYQNKQFEHIIFDFDSTLLRGESLDILAEFCNVGNKVKKLTEDSMNGLIPLEKAMEAKMDIISPSFEDIQKVVENCKNIFVEDAKELILALQFLKKKVYVLTSNFYHVVNPLAEILNIPLENIFANDMYFNENGKYIGINKESFLGKSDGKLRVLKNMLINHSVTVMVGDSVTDLVCKEVAGLFIGFGGVAKREKVFKEADAYISNVSLAPLLYHVLLPNELNFLEKNGFSEIIEKAQRLATTTTDTTGGKNSW